MNVELKNVEEKDFKFLFELRNNPEVRKYMFNKNELKWERHVEYWKKRISEKIPSYTIVADGKYTGIIKLDWSEFDECYYVSIIIMPEYQRKGIAKMALELLENKFRTKKIRAKIIPENEASKKLFESAGFKLRCLEYEL